MFELNKIYRFYFEIDDMLNYEEAELLELDDHYFKVCLIKRDVHGKPVKTCVKYYNKRIIDIVMPNDQGIKLTKNYNFFTP